jgi:hypothetical protein
MPLKGLIKKNMEGMGWDNSIIIYPSVGNSDKEIGKKPQSYKAT